MNFSFKFGTDIVWVLIAMAGGVARYLDVYLKGGDTPRFGLLLANALVSGFSGFMMVQFVLKFSPDWAIIAAGAGGYMGTQGLDWLAGQFKHRFGHQHTEDKDK